MNILFMCFANSVRSQMAEGLAKEILGSTFNVQSAGYEALYKVHPCTIKVMQEVGIDISKCRSKSIEDLPPNFMLHIDYIITLCSEEKQINTGYRFIQLFWPVRDPISIRGGTEEEQLKPFREARDTIKRMIEGFAWELGKNS